MRPEEFGSLEIMLWALHLPVDPPEPQSSPLVSVTAGELPVVITASHGGQSAVPGVPERTGTDPRTGRKAQQFETVLDSQTAELSEAISDAFHARTGKRPYVVIARFARRFIDANRPLEDALEHASAEPFYKAFHLAVRRSVDHARAKFGGGRLYDIHGQGSNREVVYRGTRSRLTLKTLLEMHGEAALTGPQGWQTQLESKGWTFIPAAADMSRETKFNGGYIVQTYGSHQPGGIDAIQLEFGMNYRRATDRKKTAAALVDVTLRWLEIFPIKR